MERPPLSAHPLTVAFGIDNTFAMPLAATLHSLLDGLSGQDSPHLYVVSQDITPANKERLHRVVAHRGTLHWLALPDRLVDPELLTTPAYLSPATFYKVFLPPLLPPDCRRVLYLDADVIVQGDLRDLWEHEMQGRLLMAVRDAGVFNVASPLGLRNYEALGLSPDTPYFNGGVLLIDVERWREERVTEHFLEYSKQYGHHARFGDQDGLNALLHDRWGPLPEQWNLQTNIVDGRAIPGPPARPRYVAQLRARLDHLTAGSFIVHYTEPRKPWHPGCTHPHRSLFHHHFRRSGCFASPLGYRTWYTATHLAWLWNKLRKMTRKALKKTKKRLSNGSG